MDGMKEFVSNQLGEPKYTEYMYIDPAYPNVKIHPVSRNEYYIEDGDEKFTCRTSRPRQGLFFKSLLYDFPYATDKDRICECEIYLPEQADDFVSSYVAIRIVKNKKRGLAKYGYLALKMYMNLFVYDKKLVINSDWKLQYCTQAGLRDQYDFVNNYCYSKLTKDIDTILSDRRLTSCDIGVENGTSSPWSVIVEAVNHTFSAKNINRLFGYEINKISIKKTAVEHSNFFNIRLGSSETRMDMYIYASKKQDRYVHIFNAAFDGAYFVRVDQQNYDIRDVDTHIKLYGVRIIETETTLIGLVTKMNVLKLEMNYTVGEDIYTTRYTSSENKDFLENMLIVALRGYCGIK